ncbi:potassium transporter TrkA [Candidatus Acetothermia bacterium]|nr:MAG: potassium transporter TrkA [Candidatus Acetothermia bacterium]
MVALISLFVVVVLSLVITRVATVALTLTGLSREVARFQARSAFSGVGFTTSESELVVSHPVRRRIVLLLMLLGNAGIVSAIASLVLSFLSAAGPREVAVRLVILVVGLGALWTLARSKLVDRYMGRVIGWALRRWTQLEVRDYADLLDLHGDYRVVEHVVEPGDWLAGRTLADLKLREEGVLVLGIRRADGTYIGAPRGWTEVRPGDTLIVYGRAGLLEELCRRRAGPEGDRAHEKAVKEQERILERERLEDTLSR